jgi:HK97 family phage major capsid protein
MTLEQRLAALKAEAAALREKALNRAPEFTAEDAERAEAIVREQGEVQGQIERAQRAAASLGAVADAAPAQSSDQNNGGQDDMAGKTLGQRFTASKAYQTFKTENPSGLGGGSSSGESAPISIKARHIGGGVASKASTINTGAQGNARAVRTGDVDDLVNRPPRRLLQVITRGRTNLPWFQYRQIISKTNNAAIVGEAVTDDATTAAGGLKPLSTLGTTTAEARAFTYADGMEVTNQELSDDGIIEALIDSTLRENLEILVEDVLLNGAGTADEPRGILATSGVQQQAFVTDAPTTIRKAITRLSLINAPIRGVLLNPEDDEAWDLLKDANDRYLGNGPFGVGPGTAWGYERIATQALPVGQAIIGDFATIQLLQLEDLTVNAFNQHADFARRNLVYVRAEERAVQLIRNAARLCVVDLAAG